MTAPDTAPRSCSYRPCAIDPLLLICTENTSLAVRFMVSCPKGRCVGNTPRGPLPAPSISLSSTDFPHRPVPSRIHIRFHGPIPTVLIPTTPNPPRRAVLLDDLHDIVFPFNNHRRRRSPLLHHDRLSSHLSLPLSLSPWRRRGARSPRLHHLRPRPFRTRPRRASGRAGAPLDHLFCDDFASAPPHVGASVKKPEEEEEAGDRAENNADNVSCRGPGVETGVSCRYCDDCLPTH